jgi:hypothetical protein
VARIRFRVVILVVLLCAFAAGCGGSRDKGKNMDYDRPKATGK